MTNRSSPGYLDGVRLRRGPDELIQTFRTLVQRDRAGAIARLNEERLQFPSLFILLPVIRELELYDSLNARNRAAADLCQRRHRKPGLTEPAAPPPANPETQRALRWIFETGALWDGPLPEYDPYDAVIDAAAAELIITYRDQSVLTAAADLIFRRNRKGFYIHDLAWALFRSFQPDAALHVARYLLSDDMHDVSLAARLLHLELPEDAGKAERRRELFAKYREWLQENRSFLYFTGEQFNLSSEPVAMRADPEAVYLQKEISPKNGAPASPLTEHELKSLLNFRERPREEQNLLAEYSRRLRKQNRRTWEAWMQTEPAQQVSAAKSHKEVV